MTFADIIKNSVMEQLTGNRISMSSLAMTLGLAGLLGLLVYVVYRINTRNGFYNRGFNKTLAVLPCLTAGIMIALQSSFLISLGMVGALSIVRFRNAVKDTSDLLYLFWSISIGMIVGANQYFLAVVLCFGVAALVTFLDMLPTLRAPSLLVVSGDVEAQEEEVMAGVKAFCPKAKVRSRNLTKRSKEWIVELQVKDAAGLVERVGAVSGVVSVNLISHDGEVRF